MKKQRHYFADKGPSSHSYGFSSSHVWMWELDSEESWVQKKWCCWIGDLEKTLDSLLEFKEMKPVHPKGNQSWTQTGRTDVGAKAPINTLANWYEKLTHWKRPKWWESLIAGGQDDDRGWVSWMASPTWCPGVWASSGSWEWTVKPWESSGNFPKIKELLSGRTGQITCLRSHSSYVEP